MNDIEVLKDMLAGHQKNILRYNADSFGHKEVVERIAALSHAIAAMKVVEWLKHNLEYELHWFYAGVKFTPTASQNGYTPILRSWRTGAEISAPNLADLAKKIGDGK